MTDDTTAAQTDDDAESPLPPYMTAEAGFLGLPDADASAPEAARAVVVPFPIERSVSYGGGTARGPDAIRLASHQVELFDESYWCEPVHRYGVATVEPPRVPGDLSQMVDELATLTGQILDAGRFPLILGGEHSLTPGPVRAAAARHPGLMVVQIDAHADLRDGYEDEPYSHAAAMRRCLDDPGVGLVAAGIRNISAEEIPFLEANRHRIAIHWAKDKARWSAADIADAVRGKPVYLTVDLDGFDSSLMPATGTPEPGGLMWDEVVAIVRAVAGAGTIVGADVVELAPIDGLHAPDFLAAKLSYTILTAALLGPPPATPSAHEPAAGGPAAATD
ncbi:agmatinase [Rhodothalassium salexigens]|uniref:agmatinase n=1 Tax=Rhodothalassium salexigens TaxID=1086 RepID=UPI0019130623|nr:agmatinase [Rhodothalassium salexigens]MBK5912353.1 agmatinase [Rhodothalassium salexigens]MBK5921483.1 agmatinase [Rhodothalassium salexigens]